MIRSDSATERKLDSIVREIATDLGDRADELALATFGHMHEQMPRWMSAEPMLERARRFTAESIRNELQSLARGELPRSCPAVDADGAREGARAGSPLALLLDGYRAGHQAQWAAWLEAIESDPGFEASRGALMRRGSEFFFAYAGRLSAFVTAEYMAERDEALRSSEQRRVRTVLGLLGGASAGADSLDYPVSAVHVGLVASGADAGERIRDLLAKLGGRSLVIDAGSDVWWAWLACTETETDTISRRIEAAASQRAPTALGIGSPLAGLDGLRHTHREALAAHRAAIRTGALVSYDDIALEDLASHDREQAIAFVRRELRGLEGDDARSRALLATLDAYFAAGQNAKAAAAGLGIHQQTVAQRLAVIEERTGRAPALRRAELELALRLRAWLRPEQ